MLNEFFESLTNALRASPLIALGASFVWGVLSIVLSPCHLASIPLIVAFISDQKELTTKRAFAMSLVFSIGILLTILIIGLITGLMGKMLGDIGIWGNIFVAVVFFIIGLHLLGVIPLPFFSPSKQPKFQKKNMVTAFILGLVFGVAMGPCTFAYMAPMLAVVFNIASTHFLFALFLILFYAIGHTSVIVLAGTFTEAVRKYLHWSESSKALAIVKKVCGILLFAGGIYLIWTIWS